MEQEHKLYTVDEIYQAFGMGLSSAIFVLEKSFVLPVEDRLHILEAVRRMVRNKVNLDIENDQMG